MIEEYPTYMMPKDFVRVSTDPKMKERHCIKRKCEHLVFYWNEINQPVFACKKQKVKLSTVDFFFSCPFLNRPKQLSLF